MDSITPDSFGSLPDIVKTPIAQAAIDKVKRSRGRPFGAKNYSGISLIARTMKEKGIYWVYELIDAYLLYKKQWSKYVNDPTLPAPDARLLDFWMTILPYITVKMIEKETRGERPRKVLRKRVSHSDITQLAHAEGRKL